MPASDFINLASNPSFLGNNLIRTQHLIGTSKYTQPSVNEIIGLHQMRVAHQKYKHEDLTEVVYRGHAHGIATIRYRRIDGLWKFAGLTPDIRWTEGEYEKIFLP